MHQLGPEKDQLVPRRVMELDGRAVASVSCGATHTAWYHAQQQRGH